MAVFDQRAWLFWASVHNYNPDWAFVRREAKGVYLYLVRETKGTDQIANLQWESEGWKIKFGEAHFHALNVDYLFHYDPKVLIEVSHDSSSRRGP